MFKIKESAMFALAICLLAAFVGVLRFNLNLNQLSIAFIAVFAGTFLPNLDVPFIHVRRHLKLAAFVVTLALLLYVYFFMDSKVMGLCKAEFGANSCTMGAFSFVIIVPFLVATVIDTIFPFKSGPLHGFIPAFLFGALAFVYLLGSNGLMTSAYAAGCGFFAYMVHVVLDRDYY